LSIDPDIADTGQAYAYTGDDPLNFSDPLGLSTCAQCIVSQTVEPGPGGTYLLVSEYGDGSVTTLITGYANGGAPGGGSYVITNTAGTVSSTVVATPPTTTTTTPGVTYTSPSSGSSASSDEAMTIQMVCPANGGCSAEGGGGDQPICVTVDEWWEDGDHILMEECYDPKTGKRWFAWTLIDSVGKEPPSPPSPGFTHPGPSCPDVFKQTSTGC
jgi:hypothetical protein